MLYPLIVNNSRHKSLTTSQLAKFAENAIEEDSAMIWARGHAEDLGVNAVSTSVGSFLSVMARTCGGKAIAEIGTGAGVSGLWLLSGMKQQGVLTTIDIEHDFQQAAKEAFTRAGIEQKRVRMINNPVETVLPRLSDNSYDMVFVDALLNSMAETVPHITRILRPGGCMIINSAASVDSTKFNEEEVNYATETLRSVAENEYLLPSVIPIGFGLLLAVNTENDG